MFRKYFTTTKKTKNKEKVQNDVINKKRGEISTANINQKTERLEKGCYQL